MPNIKLAIRLLWDYGFTNTINLIRYTIHRDRLNRAFFLSEASHKETTFRTPGKLIQSTALQSGARFQFEHAELEVIFLAPDLVRITWEPGIHPIPYALAKEDWHPVQVDIEETSATWTISSVALKVVVCSEGSILFLDPNHKELRNDLPPIRKGEGDKSAWMLSTSLRPEESIFGLGEQSGPLNLRGTVRCLWNTDPGGHYVPGADPIYAPMPVYISLHELGNYLVFFENSFRATFDFRANTPQNLALRQDKILGNSTDQCGFSTVSFEGGVLRYYLIPGPPPRAIERFTELTGRPPLPPLWSLGYHQSRWGYTYETEIRAVVEGFEQHNLPLSAVHLDLDYMDGYRVFTIHKGRFPNFKGMVTDLEQKGVRVIPIIDAGVKKDKDYFIYREGLEKKYFCTQSNGNPYIGMVWPGETVFPDFTNPETRAWWGRQYHILTKQGVKGFWHDMNEPTSFAAWGDTTLPVSLEHDLEGRGGNHLEAHNIYALQMNRAAAGGLRPQLPEHRPWLLSRSGWVGIQRYSWSWTGDAPSSWEGLRMTIATVLGLGLSGQPFSGSDIGGFSGSPSAELYLRWFQMSALMPFFRTHSALYTQRREPWVFGEPYLSIIGQFLRLRYRLLPYFYALAWQASQTGYPLVRPLFWNEWENHPLWQVDDAFLLGDALLVAPILESQQKQRLVTLPRGLWYSFWDDQTYNGPQQAVFQTNLDTIPLFVRGGSVLPLSEEDMLSLHIYPPDAIGTVTNSFLYSDAGDGYANSRIDRFSIYKNNNSIEMTWQSEGDFPFPYRKVEIILHGPVSASYAVIDGQRFKVDQNRISTTMFKRLHLEV